MAMEAVAAGMLGRLQPLQVFVSVVFFSISSWFLVLSLLLKLLRSRPWCNCDVCYAYVSGGWAAEFDNLCDWYTHLLRRSPTGTIHVHVLGNIITANPANVEHMLCARFDNYPKGRAFSSILGDLLGRGIFNVDGEHWRFQRKMASMELGSVSVRSYALQIVSSEARQRLLPLLASAASGGRGPDGALDLQDVFRRFSFDCICRISFGLDPGCLDLSRPISEFANAFDTASMLSASRAAMASPMVWKLKRLLRLGTEKELNRCIRLIDLLATEVITQRRKMGLFSGHDLLSRFMGTVNDDKYLRDIVVSFLLAGRDTVSSTLTSFFLLLSDHAEVENAVLDEVQCVMGNREDNDIPSYDQLRSMHYVHAALHESMRLYPPVQFDSKFAVEDDVLPDGTFVERGTRVTYHPYAMGRMEDAWGADCLQFQPSRWLAEDGSFSPENPYKYPVFQAGPRVCLGKEMAVMEMKCVIVAVVREFRLRPLAPVARHPKFAPGLTATLRGGLPARVLRRHAASRP